MSSNTPFSKEELLPQPEMLEIRRHKKELFIGLPKESDEEEKRISLTPDAVSALIANGHKVVIETGAGERANYTDHEYSEAGAKISYDVKEAFQCDIILKVQPPSLEEIKFINPQSLLISSLQLKIQDKAYFETLAKKKITAIAYNFIKDEHNAFPIVKSLSEIAGTASILIASELMSSSNNGNGMLLGNVSGIPPTSIVILGAGTVGKMATKTAIGLGARVKVFDNSVSKLRQLQDEINSPIYTSTVHLKAIRKALMRADVVIGAIRGKERSPIIVTEDMVEQMKDGAIVVDVSIDRGGCFETSQVTSHSNPTFETHGVIHYCVPNIPSKYARTASVSISNIFMPFLLNIAEEGGFKNAIMYDKILRSGVYLYQGVFTKKEITDWFDLTFYDINLLIL